MKESLFVKFISGLWPKLSLYIKTKVNNGQSRTYLHKTMLTPVYSTDGKWEGTSANTTYVAADMVSLDSELPLKKRGSIAVSNGKIPKVGMLKSKNETVLTSIYTMIDRYDSMSRSQDDTIKAQAAEQKKRIVQRFADDATACSIGIDEKNESNFLQAISDGILAVEDADNVGTALRCDYGYDKFPGNHFGVEVKGHISRDDIERVIDKSEENGDTVTTIMIATSTYRAMRKERWARELVANDEGRAFTSADELAVPSEKRFDEAFASEFGGIQFLKVNRSVSYEKNGQIVSKKPFNADKLIFLTSEEVGSLVWAVLVESRNPVEGVKYTTVDDYKLISEYSENNPLCEFTSGQALVIPVIENVDQIYSIDVQNAHEVNEEAEKQDSTDIYITIDGKKYSKPAVITALNDMGFKTSAKASDDTVIKKVNALSDEQEAELMSKLEVIE